MIKMNLDLLRRAEAAEAGVERLKVVLAHIASASTDEETAEYALRELAKFNG